MSRRMPSWTPGQSQHSGHSMPARQVPPAPPLHISTFALPVGMRSKADVAAVLAVELSHEGLVGVPDEQDGSVEGLDLLLATLVCLDADGPPAAPMVSLTFKPFPQPGGGEHGSEFGEAGSPAHVSQSPEESSYVHSFTHSFTHIFTEDLLCARHCPGSWIHDECLLYVTVQ